jgi:RNA polymerase sigma-70 factor (ECF subfamily)
LNNSVHEQETSRQTTPVNQLVDHLFRHRAGQMVSSLTRVFGPANLELAEDVVQETLLKALQLWSYQGIPANPDGWLIQTARNRAVDVLRRDANFRAKVPLAVDWSAVERGVELETSLDDPLGDDQLTMIFLCCHPALAREARVALTLKTVGGFSVSEIARAFLVSDDAIAQRLVRAKRKIRDEHIAFELPDGDELAARLDSVLGVLYLLFNEGYGAYQGEDLVRHDLCAEAIRLGSLLVVQPVGKRPEVYALLALMLLHASRLAARVDDAGNLRRLAEQDRSRWDRGLIQRGMSYLALAADGDVLTEYHLLAGIAACHATADRDEATDWPMILQYYDGLVAINSSPVIALNRAVALAMVRGTSVGIAEVERLAGQGALRRYYLLPATLGELYERAGRREKAAEYYRLARDLAANETEKRFLGSKLAATSA